jgi:hypothetical protein
MLVCPVHAVLGGGSIASYIVLSGWFVTQTVVMTLLVVVGYTLAWLPLNLFQLYMVRPSEESPLPHIEYVFFSVHWLAMAHTAYNPLIYAWINIRFRSAFLQVNTVSSLIANTLDRKSSLVVGFSLSNH